MKSPEQKKKRWIIFLWLLIISSALYFYLFKHNLLLERVDEIRSLPIFWIGAAYLILGCIRGFTLIPVTYLIILGLIFLPPTHAYILTMIGVMVSSTCIYYFSEYLKLALYFQKNYPDQIAKLTSVLKKNEFPIVLAWSGLPFTATDLICYVCGSLEIDIKKFLLAVFIGEGITCALYIYLGMDIFYFFFS